LPVERSLVAEHPSYPALRELARRYDARPLDDVPYQPLPLADQALEQDEEVLKARLGQLSYELPAGEWRPLPCGGEPIDAPRRFIDGSVFSRTVAAFSVEGRRRPAVLACLGALALHLDGGRLVRPRDGFRLRTVLCLLSNGMRQEDLRRMADSLAALPPQADSPLARGESPGRQAKGIELVTAETAELVADFEVLRRRTWDLAKERMEEAEREVLLAQPQIPAVVDGLLERRLVTVASQAMPAVGVVKRQMRRYLPDSYLSLLYDLASGERTPAFLLETEHATVVSWYLRLSPADGLAPGYGVVRLAVPQEYLERRFPAPEERWAQLSALSAWLRGLRCREKSYPRAGVSLEPIVRVEDELHALLPDIRQVAARLQRALGI
jgi:hypothetical protein